MENCTIYDGNKYLYSNSHIHEDHEVYLSKLCVCLRACAQRHYITIDCGIAYM
jgi:hypothetical protein